VLKSDGNKPTLTGPLGDLAAKLSPQHLWMAATPDGLRTLLTNPGAASAPAGLTDLANAGDALAVWLTVQDGKVDLHAGVQCGDDAAAQRALATLQTAVPQVLSALEASAASKAAIVALIGELRSSAKFAASGTLAEMSAQVSVPAVEAALPELEALARGQP
jgi:hypothetical protein